MRIRVCTMRNTDGVWVTIDQEATVWDLKELLENEKAIGVPAPFSRLMLRNERADEDDDKRLSQVGVEGGSVLWCGGSSLTGARLSCSGTDASDPAVAILLLTDAERAEANPPEERLRVLARRYSADDGASFSASPSSPFSDADRNMLRAFASFVQASRLLHKLQSLGTNSASAHASAHDSAHAAAKAETNSLTLAQSGNPAVAQTAAQTAAQTNDCSLAIVLAARQVTALLAASGNTRAQAERKTRQLLQYYECLPQLAKLVLCMYAGPSDACIPFHCDSPTALCTTEIALNDDFEGGRFAHWGAQVLTQGPAQGPAKGSTQSLCPHRPPAMHAMHVTHRPAGTVTRHAHSVLHGVTRMVSGTRVTFVVCDEPLGLGCRDQLDLALEMARECSREGETLGVVGQFVAKCTQVQDSATDGRGASKTQHNK